MNARLVLLATLLSGCNGDSSGNQNGSHTELNANIGVDLSNVVGLVISKSSSAGTTSLSFPNDTTTDGGAAQNQLYALEQDGTLTIVTVVSVPDGGTSSSSQAVEPVGVFDTRLYLFLMYWGVTHEGVLCDLIAVRKQDGAMYCVANVGNPGSWEAGGEQRGYWKIIQSDASGQTVWIDHNQKISRLDLGDPANPTMTQPLGPGPFGASQAVNADGDDLVSQSSGPNGTPPFTRVARSAGGFFNVSDKGMNCIAAGPPSSGSDFFYLENVGPTTVDNEWVRLVKSPGTFTRVKLAAATWADCSAGLARAGGHFFLSGVLQTPSTPGANHLIDASGGQASLLTVDALHQLTQIAGWEQALFVLGTDSTGSGGIVRYDVSAATFATLLPPGAYNVTKMDVSPTGDVTFYGQRASDGAYVLGTVPAGSSTVEVVSTGLPEVVQIQRIN